MNPSSNFSVPKIGVVGDLILAESPLLCGLGPCAATHGKLDVLFREFKETSKDYDFLIGNFETVLIENCPRFTPTDAMKTPKGVLPCLYELGFRYFSMANNHSMEYGPEIYHQTKAWLEQAGLTTFGHKEKPYVSIPTHGGKIALLAFSSVPAMYGYEPLYYFVDKKEGQSWKQVDNLLTELRKTHDFIWIYPHWGSEFMREPAPWQYRFSARLFSMGADLILGSHPHIIQTIHDYSPNQRVYFSLGNFISDYPQEPMKRNYLIEISLSTSPIITHRVLTSNKDFRIQEATQCQEGEDRVLPWPGELESESEYEYRSILKRKLIRNQLLSHLLKHPVKCLLNVRKIWWILHRAWFLFVNRKKIRSNPDAVYSGPIH